MESQNDIMYREEQKNVVMSVKDWVITLLIFAIPIAGIIMMFVWAFSNDVNLNKKNLSRAYLIFTGIMIALSFLFYIVMVIIMAAFIGAMNSQMY